MRIREPMNPQLTWIVWLMWTGASTLGFTFAGLMFHFPSGFPPNNGANWNIPAFVFGLVMGSFSGLVSGGLQALVLRRYFSRARGWIVANIAAFAIIHAIGDALPDSFALLTVQIIGGVILGTALWLVFKLQRASAPLWILAVSVAWFVGLTLGLTIANQFAMDWQMGHIVAGLTTGIAIALATGALLMELMGKVSRIATESGH